jgi:hypothetical protein
MMGPLLQEAAPTFLTSVSIELESQPTPQYHILQTLTVAHEYEDVPRMHLRDNFRNSFTRGSILNLGKHRLPT